MLISDAFAEESVPTTVAPANAMPYTSQADLNVALNNQVVVGSFYQGEILRSSDPRLVLLGMSSPNSLTNLNPAQLPAGSVLTQLVVNTSGGGKPPAVAGDIIDVLVTECNLPGSKDPGSCETQTTLQSVYVYAVNGNALVLVMTHQDALALKYLNETGKAEVVIRKPGDTQPITTQAVDGAYVVKDFNY